MDVHLITTDQTSFKLLESINETFNITCVIVPSNRRDTKKVERVVKMAESRKISVYILHLQSRFSNSLPPLVPQYVGFIVKSSVNRIWFGTRWAF